MKGMVWWEMILESLPGIEEINQDLEEFRIR